MRFDVPYIINEEPVKEYWYTVYSNEKKAALAFKTAKKVYKRTRLAEAQNWRCCWCGTDTIPEPNKRNSVTLEHILPKSQGGSDEMDNLAAACAHCNSRRGTKHLQEFLAILAKKNKKLKVA